MSKFTVGQTVVIREQYAPDREVEVTRVGRTNVYINHFGRERAFDAETGCQKGTVIGTPDRILTFDEVAEQKRRAAVRERLTEHGITSTGYSGFKQDTATLEAIAELLDGRSS